MNRVFEQFVFKAWNTKYQMLPNTIKYLQLQQKGFYSFVASVWIITTVVLNCEKPSISNDVGVRNKHVLFLP